MNPATLFWLLVRRALGADPLEQRGTRCRWCRVRAWGVVEVQAPSGRVFWVGSRYRV